ncbi:MAG: TonB-dependent receptor [Hymenobacter sp.]|nr:TonB-dependent receptor [Hymenobacter sp.]
MKIINLFGLLLGWLLAGPAAVHGQGLQGTVSAEAGGRLAFASVAVLNSPKGTTCDQDGQFALRLPAGTYQLLVSAVGFAALIRPVVVAASGDNAPLVIVLKERSRALDEVVVTAEKTEADAQRTPAAISVLTACQLREYRVWSFSDLGALAPSLQTVEHGGSTSSLFLNIRGAMGLHSQSAVATYIDGVYQFEAFSVPLQFNNVARIEVLRGPQGTLYGRNAFGGVINIITKKPTNQAEGQVQVDAGNYAQQRYQLSFSTSVIKDKLFVGASGLFSQRRGIYTDAATGQAFDRPQSIAGGLNLRYVASDRLSVEVNGRFERNDDVGAYPWVASEKELFAQPYVIGRSVSNRERRDNLSASVNLKYETRPVVFTSISAFLDYQKGFPEFLDGDFTAANLSKALSDDRVRTFTQELRLASNPALASALTWTAGTYLWTAPDGSNEFVQFRTPATGPASTFYRSSRSDNRGLAFFGQAAYRFAPRLTATAGLRYDREYRELAQSRRTVAPDGAESMGAPLTSFGTTFEAVTPKGVLGFQATDNTLVYGQYARGYRAGGLNVFAPTAADVPFGPEYSHNYEVGVKNTFFADQLRLNLTGFYLQQRDQQVTVIENSSFLTRNTGDMHNLGAELELMAVPAKGLQAEWTASLSRAEYARLTTVVAGRNQDLAGNKPLFNPKAASFLALQYSRPLTPRLSAFVRGEHRYSGAYYLNFDNVIRQSPFHVFNGRAGVRYKTCELAFWGRNLTEVRYRTWATGVFLLNTPRLWGATATVSF